MKNKQIFFHCQKGFTLMETLLAVTLLAVVCISATSVFSMGLQIWKRTRQSSGMERKALLALEKISVDLRSAAHVKPPTDAFSLQGDHVFNYEGKSNEIMIPVLLTPAEGSQLGGYGRKTYRWNSSTHEICRSVETAADLFRKNKPICEPLAKNITKMQFRYRLHSGLAKSYSWYDAWELKSGIPLGVEIEMEFTPDITKAQKKLFHRTIAIPVGD